jgi:hypothetical protein
MGSVAMVCAFLTVSEGCPIMGRNCAPVKKNA